MVDNNISIRKLIQDMKVDLGISEHINCTEEENKEFSLNIKLNKDLPEDVYYYSYFKDNPDGTLFYRYRQRYTDEEIREYLRYKNLETLNNIKKQIDFFITLALIGILGIILGAIYFFS